MSEGLLCDRHVSSKNCYRLSRLSLRPHHMPERHLTHWCSEKVNCQPYIAVLSSLDVVLTFVVVHCSVAQSYSTLCNPMDWSTPGFPVVHHLPCPLSQWCHPTISSSVVPFSCLQSFPASGSFPMSQLFAPGGQSIKHWYFLHYNSHHGKLNSNQQHASNEQSRELQKSCHTVTVMKTMCFRRSEEARMIELRWARKALLVVQWWRVHLAIQGTSVQSPVREDPTCHGALELVRHCYWACAPDPMLPKKRNHCNEKLMHCNKEELPLATTRESLHPATKTEPSRKNRDQENSYRV